MLETERLLLRRPSGAGKYEEDGAVIGRVGVQFLDPETWQPAAAGQPELGWTLHEGRPGVVRGGRLVSLIPPDNVRSQAVARRLGAVPGREVRLPRDGTYVIWEHMQG